MPDVVELNNNCGGTQIVIIITILLKRPLLAGALGIVTEGLAVSRGEGSLP